MWEMKTTCSEVTCDATTCDGAITCEVNKYSWTSSLAAGASAADGTLFTTFIAGLNGGDYYDPSAGQVVSAGAGSCFANHCDWRIPTHRRAAYDLRSQRAWVWFRLSVYRPRLWADAGIPLFGPSVRLRVPRPTRFPSTLALPLAKKSTTVSRTSTTRARFVAAGRAIDATGLSAASTRPKSADRPFKRTRSRSGPPRTERRGMWHFPASKSDLPTRAARRPIGRRPCVDALDYRHLLHRETPTDV